jgi:SNF2 family DNA or RNA helicase
MDMRDSLTLEELHYSSLENVINESKEFKERQEPLFLEDAAVATIAATAGMFAVLKVAQIYNNSELSEKVAKTTENVFGNVFGRVVINKKDNEIIIKGINYKKLIQRIKEMYKERKLDSIFERKYRWLDQVMYKRKVIKRKSDMEIVNLHIPMFFALELSAIFEELYAHYGFTYYLKIVKQLYSKTWMKNLISNRTEQVNLSALSNLSYTLKDYQKEFVEKYKTLKLRSSLRGFILSFDQGLGKTLTSIALTECLGKDRVYIICPNSLKENWAYEIKQYFKKYAGNDDLFKEEVFIVGHKKYGYGKNTKYVICNQEAIEKVFPYVTGGDNMLIVDEMHNFRNMTGKRVTDLVRLRDMLKCDDNLLMSGTPIKATPNEIIPSMMILDPTFDLKAAKMYNRVFNIDDTATAGIVQKRFGRIIYRRTKKQVLDLPRKNQLPFPLPLKAYEKFLLSNVNEVVGKRYEEIYQENVEHNESLKREYVKMVEMHSSSSSMDRMRYLRWIDKAINTDKRVNNHELTREFLETYAERYILPNISSEEEKKRFVKLYNDFVQMKKSSMGKALGEILPKYRAEMYIALYNENKKEIIKRIKENPKKTVIFSMMLDVVKHISKDLEEQGVGNVKVIGETKDRMEVIRAFKERDDIDVLVATSQTLSTGVTLTEANQMFFFGTPWRSADYEQACDRIHRIGQTSEVNIFNVLLATAEPNLSTRMQDILQWSNKMFGSMVDNEDAKDKLIGKSDV